MTSFLLACLSIILSLHIHFSLHCSCWHDFSVIIINGCLMRPKKKTHKKNIPLFPVKLIQQKLQSFVSPILQPRVSSSFKLPFCPLQGAPNALWIKALSHLSITSKGLPQELLIKSEVISGIKQFRESILAIGG